LTKKLTKHHVQRWLKDRQIQRLLKNASILLTGNLTTSVFELISLALTARAIGPEVFGVLVLVQTYVTVVDALTNFQSWQAIIKYGADALVEKRHESFKSLIKFGTYLDFSTAAIATMIAIIGLYGFGSWWGLDGQALGMTAVYTLVILSNVVWTPTAILRLFNRFKCLAVLRTATAAVKMICIGVAFLLGSGLWTFLLIWMLTNIVGNLVTLVVGWFELKRQGYHRVMSANVRNISQEYPGVWKFVGTTNLSSSIRMGAEYFDVFFVGIILGPAATGVYKIAKQFGRIPAMLGQPIQQTAYPDMAKLWAEGAIKRFRNYILLIGGLGGSSGLAIWLFFFVAGNWIINTVVGSEYGSAYAPMLIYMLGNVIYLFGVAFLPAILSMHHPERVLYIYAGGHVIFFPVLFVMVSDFGLIGAAIAQVTFHVSWFIGMTVSIVMYLKKGAEAKSVDCTT